MKQIIWVALLAAAVSLTGLFPFESNDVADLVPVEALLVDVQADRVILKGNDCQGSGTDWPSALEDLRQSGEGTVFLGTAEQVVLSRSATALLPDVIRSTDLRPAAVLCICDGELPEPDKAAEYLSARNAGTTIQKVQAIMLRGEGIQLPVLEQTEGGLRLRGTEDR